MGSSEDALYFQIRYNGFAVGHYLRYPSDARQYRGGPFVLSPKLMP